MVRTISDRISAVMTGESKAGWFLNILLGGFETLYRIAVYCRNRMYDSGMLPVRRLPCSVICVGNLTAGGTGKTPMTIYLVRLLNGIGFRTAVISRGYKGTAEHGSAVVSDGDRILSGPEIAGDEPYMMAKKLEGIPVLVGADRFQVGMKAVEKFSPDVIVCDDAFQHRRLHRDMDIVLIDDATFLGNRHLLPKGILREPASSMARADLLVLTRCKNGKSRSLERLSKMAPGKPVFTSFHESYVCGIYKGKTAGETGGMPVDSVQNFNFLRKSNVFVFSGIARNDAFFNTVAALSNKVVGAMAFDDHHRYRESDLCRISDQAAASDADYIVTTEKDYVKIAGRMNSPVDIVVLGVRLVVRAEETEFLEQIRKKIASG